MSALNSEDRLLAQGHSYFTNNVFETTRELYFETNERTRLLLETDQGTSHGSSLSREDTPIQVNYPVYHATRLPRIDLPKFNGTLSDWLSFKDLFHSLVIVNHSITAVEKLQYLKTSLTGSAAHLLKNMAVTEDNFPKAWETLSSFYENKTLLVNAALQSLLNLKRMNKESAMDLERLYTSAMQIYTSLETLRRPVESWDDFLVFLIVQRLDSETVKAWEQLLGATTEPPTWIKFTDFLVSRLRSLQAYERSRSSKSSITPLPTALKAHYQGKSKEKEGHQNLCCSLCSAKHHPSNCHQYRSKSLPQRLEIISKHKLCYNCLGTHRVAACRTVRRCVRCGKKHHTSIHPGFSQPTKAEPDSTKPTKPSTVTSATETARAMHSIATATVISPRVLLATAQVRLVSSNGNVITVRALIDKGSEVSLITERTVQLLRMSRTRSSVSLTGIGGKASNKTRGVVNVHLRPNFPSEFQCAVTAHILTHLTAPVPSATTDQTLWPHLEGLQLADPLYSVPGSIDMILGADLYGSIIGEGLIRGTLNSPIAQYTNLGWIISGPTREPDQATVGRVYHVKIEDNLYSLLHKFWELEEVPPSPTSSLSPEEQACVLHFETTHTRDSQGRYTVRLPFRKSPDLLGNSKEKAVRFIYRLHQKFESDPNYAQLYSDFIKEYAELQHMILVPDADPEPPASFYLPHHGVVRETSRTTRLRVVFNGSSKTTSGSSLNDLLHIGPKLQTDLFDVLIWFRQFPYVFSSDIEKMYRQIQVHPDDWRYQRIFWINSEGSLNTYQLTTVTYGLKCAPFLALSVMNQLIQDEGKEFPQAVPVLTHGRYMDDIFGGGDSIDQARELVNQVNQLCMAGGFRLQKWATNQADILDVLPERNQTSSSSIRIEEATTIPSLGVTWQPHTDSFKFTYLPIIQEPVTKRTVLSTIAKIFDPLGLISPITIGVKIIMQELWSLKLNWDDPLPSSTTRRWAICLDALKDLPTLNFPRWIGLKSNQPFELHGFSDASPQAYSVVVYSRTTSEDGIVHAQLICSKTKVAPLKRITIPRLELAGATLLTKLVKHLLRLLDRLGVPIYLWTDSTVTHTWISNHPSRWKDFVHNRVCFIQETLPQAQWGIVPGAENPADLAIRGLTPRQLSEHLSWWTGPIWLVEPPSSWPTLPINLEEVDNLEERPVQITTVGVQPSECWDLLTRYSSLKRLLRITALCRRVIDRFRKIPNSSLVYPITTQELQTAKLFWVRVIQQSNFNPEIQLLSDGNSIPSSLTRLTPHLDPDGILRVGGRLQSSSLSHDSKHPIILPKQSPFTTLVIADAHLRTCHGGTQLTLYTIREEFWIIGGRVPIRSYILKCIRCTRFRRARAQQRMGPLPKERVTPSRPFLNAGVDYAGPLTLKTWRGKNARTYKAYIALFVCLATSAIHLELVTDYTTDAFIAAYKRFTARRGICATLWCDCGTNFKGAEATLQQLFTAATKEARHLADLLATDGTQWKFNPPSAPHFGGKWEAGVKSVKYHLRRAIGESVLTYEEMTTFLIQVEAILNSRPLCPCSDDPEDLTALTPGHFLIGNAPKLVPEPSLEEERISRLSRWQLLRQMIDHFWTRWSRESLQRYHAISKWTQRNKTIHEGSLVLIVDERYPAAKWPLGRVTATHPGEDGLIRVVTVKTSSSTFKRPIVKLCPLPIPGDTL
ncbi:PREDICTED: uncharacterized protein LOC108767469 [Trachymyrmex cornetzi]|uniref:uncharacterized protein LOC108767469 n=1 Tax=Trachymyrmex cornetzi TaxID=471704 RepID=UPI00084F4DB5|nr:PREDICTED: uncharacterized protein LOC108767469 [Trachymyrmex cornetzi]